LTHEPFRLSEAEFGEMTLPRYLAKVGAPAQKRPAGPRFADPRAAWEYRERRRREIEADPWRVAE
jgi:hypothetical protein